LSRCIPNIAAWVNSCGWIDIGDDGQSSSFVRALNEGDLVWEDNDDDATLDEVLEACDTFLADEMSQYGKVFTMRHTTECYSIASKGRMNHVL
jgi:hypothetical protein